MTEQNPGSNESFPAPDPGAAGSAAVPAGDDSVVGRLRDLFAKPARLMDHVASRPLWWVPGLIALVVVAVFSWLTLPISGPEQMEMMRDSKLMSMMPESQWQAQYEAAMNPSVAKRLTSSLTAGIMAWLMLIIFGFALGFFARMSGGKGTFKQALGVTSWAALLPFGVGPLVKAPLVLATESVSRVNIGLAALLPGADVKSPVFLILQTYGDFIAWWGLAVTVIGFSRVFGLSRGGAAVAVLVPWALLSLIPLGMALLFM